MKRLFFGVAILYSISFTAQIKPDSLAIERLYKNILQSKNGEKLKWMDSLSNTVLYQTNLKYDSIVRATISYAKTIDSIALAGMHTANLIYYYNAVIGQPEVGKSLFEEFTGDYDKFKKPQIMAQLYINVADSYYYTGAIKESIGLYIKAGTYATQTNDLRVMGLAKLYEGYSKSDLGEFSAASKDIKEAAEYFRTIKDTFNLIGAKVGIAVQYSQANFLEEAFSERQEAIVLAKQSKNYNSLVSLYFNNATDFRFMGKTQERIDNIKEAIAIAKKATINKETEHLLHTNLVVAYVEHNDLKNAERSFKDVLTYGDFNNQGKSKESYIEAKKWLEYLRGNYIEAIKLGETYLRLKTKRGMYGEILQTYRFLNLAYSASGNTTKAYSSLKNYMHLKDSVTDLKNIKSLAFYQTLYETEKMDSKIKIQQVDIELLYEKSKQKNQFMVFGTIGLLSVFGFILIIRSRNKAKQRQRLQVQFSQDLMKSQETERTRIAKDLHDSVGQQLTLIKQKSQNAHQDEITTLTQHTLEDVRIISRGLYPTLLKQLGLSASIEQLTLEFDETSDVFFSVDIDDIDEVFNEDESLNYYRFIQECITNVIKHSKARTVSLRIKKQNNEIITTISDNGIGFNKNNKFKQNSLGLKTLKERIVMLKGVINIESESGIGTTITAKTPIK